MLTIDFGTSDCRRIEVAATASGGEIIPPSRNPSASVKPGISQFAVKATTHEVRITIGKAKPEIKLRQRQNSFHETCQDASYSKGGRKSRKTISGSIVIFENAATKLSASPPRTSTIGYATRSLFGEHHQAENNQDEENILNENSVH